MERLIFWSVFYCFFRLQIYEAIAAIFWQSASYVYNYYYFYYYCYYSYNYFLISLLLCIKSSLYQQFEKFLSQH